MNDEIALVDLDDRITGYALKADVHRDGLLHRACSIFITNGSEMLLQRRNVRKYHSGGLWSNACCSHQRRGEELEEAVHRRLREELGFDCELRESFRFVYRTEFRNGLTEYEYDHVFVGRYDGPVTADPEEAEEIMWVPFGELTARLETSPEEFSSWFVISAPAVLASLERR